MLHVYIKNTTSCLQKALLTTHHISTPVMDTGNKAVLPHNNALRLNTTVPYSSSGHKNPADAVLGQT